MSTPTGERDGWPLYPLPSSGGLNPVRLSASDGELQLETDPHATIAKYGPSGVVSAEVDLGVLLPAVAALAWEAGTFLVAEPSPTGITIACRHTVPAAVPPAGSSIKALLRNRRSRRIFGSDPVQTASIERVLRSARLMDTATRRMLPDIPLASVHLAIMAGPDIGWYRVADGALTLISSNPPDATSLAEAACDQSFVSEGSAVAVVTTGSEDGDVDVAEAWSVGAAGSGLHLATTAAGLHSCIVGAVRPGLLRALAPSGRAPAIVRGLTLLVPIGSATPAKEPG